MKKIPWMSLGFLSATYTFFLTIAIVVIYFVLQGIAGATSGSISIFQEWYQILLFILDVIFCALSILCFVMYFIKRKEAK